MGPTEPLARGSEPRAKLTVRIGDPLAAGIGQPIPIVLPEPATLFARRAGRLEQLAAGHPMEAWLRFMANLARAQDRARETLPLLAPIRESELDAALNERTPPFAVEHRRPDPAWHAGLRAIVREMTSDLLPADASEAMDRLAAANAAVLDTLAEGYLRGGLESRQLGEAVYVAAALQLYFAEQAAALPIERLPLLPTRGRCPVCGSAPLAGVITAAGRAPGTRYLHCRLCATAWNHARAVCVNCGDSRSLVLHEIEGSDGAAKAETCDACRGYGKMFYEENDMAIEPLADDLVSLGLDLMVSAAGWSRHAPNPFVIAEQ